MMFFNMLIKEYNERQVFLLIINSYNLSAYCITSLNEQIITFNML